MTADHHASRGQSEDIRACKGGVPRVCMTAYTTPMAKSLDGYRDLLLVGVFLAKVICGRGKTHSVIFDIMIFQGRAVKLEGREEIAETDTAIVDAAAFLLVIEGTVEPVAHAIMEDVDMSTIGTGAPPACEGQILVIQDMVGLFADFTAKFVKQCPDWRAAMRDAASAYAEDVWSASLPSLERSSG